MTELDPLAATIREWSRALDATALPQVRESFLGYMTRLGFSYETVTQDGDELTIFRYIDDDGVPIYCGDWIATLAHLFKHQWTQLDPLMVSRVEPVRCVAPDIYPGLND